MMTLVPIGTRPYRSSESEMYIRMQPCDAYVPIDEELYVPWMRMPGAFRYGARVPSGLPGPGPIDGGRSAPHVSSAGLYHVGFSCLFTSSHVPIGVVYGAIAVATGYSLTTCSPSYRYRWFSDRSTTIEAPSEAVVTFGSSVRTGTETWPARSDSAWRIRAVAACIASSCPVRERPMTSSPSTSANLASTAGSKTSSNACWTKAFTPPRSSTNGRSIDASTGTLRRRWYTREVNDMSSASANAFETAPSTSAVIPSDAGVTVHDRPAARTTRSP